MEEIRNILEESLHIDFIQATISNPKTKGGVTKIKVRPVMVKGGTFDFSVKRLKIIRHFTKIIKEKRLFYISQR